MTKFKAHIVPFTSFAFLPMFESADYSSTPFELYEQRDFYFP